MTPSLAKLTGALVASAGLAWTGTAWAEPQDAVAAGAGYSAADAPLGAPTELRIDLRGQVPARCDVTPPRDMGRMVLNEDGEVRGVFGIDCNTPFLLRVRSENGGFAASQAMSADSKAGYRLGVELGTDEGRQDLGWCTSAQLATDASGACAFGAANPKGGWSSGDAIAIRQSGALRLSWDGREDGPGAYQDNIIIEVEVRS